MISTNKKLLFFLCGDRREGEEQSFLLYGELQKNTKSSFRRERGRGKEGMAAGSQGEKIKNRKQK